MVTSHEQNMIIIVVKAVPYKTLGLEHAQSSDSFKSATTDRKKGRGAGQIWDGYRSAYDQDIATLYPV